MDTQLLAWFHICWLCSCQSASSCPYWAAPILPAVTGLLRHLGPFSSPWAISLWRSVLLTYVWNSSQILCFSPLCCSSGNEITIVLHKSFKSIIGEFEKIETLAKEVVYRIVWTYLIQWLGPVCFHLCIFKWRKRFYRFIYWVAFTSSLKTYFV